MKSDKTLNRYPELEFSAIGFSDNLKQKQMQLDYLQELRNDLYKELKYNSFMNSDIIESGIIGFVVGDALGVPVEFMSRDDLKKNPLREMIGYGSHFVPEGTWSDDTSMMLATIDSIVEKGCIKYDDIMNKFLNWFCDAKYTATDEVFDIGFSTSDSIAKFKNGISVDQCGGKNYNDNGNGSLMRILPIAYYLHFNSCADNERFEIVNNVSSLTHAHEISCLGCKIYCDYVNCLLNGLNKYDALDFIKKIKYNEFYSDNSVLEYKKILIDDISKFSVQDICSTGYVVHTLEACLWSLLNSNNYEQAVLTAINLGGDTDTIGAITGALAGIIYGKNQIPEKWLNKLKKRDYLENMCQEFVDYFTLIFSYNNNKIR